MHSTNESAGNGTSLTDKVMQFTGTVVRLLDEAKQPGFEDTGWAPLAELVATQEFERVGIWREVMNWQEFVSFQTQFARRKGLETRVLRITEAASKVFYEIEERHITDSKVNVVNSMNVFDFNEDGKIRRMDIYIQGVVEPSIPLQAMRFRP